MNVSSLLSCELDATSHCLVTRVWSPTYVGLFATASAETGAIAMVPAKTAAAAMPLRLVLVSFMSCPFSCLMQVCSYPTKPEEHDHLALDLMPIGPYVRESCADSLPSARTKYSPSPSVSGYETPPGCGNVLRPCSAGCVAPLILSSPSCVTSTVSPGCAKTRPTVCPPSAW